jgi:SAM-dependent methyltransferase
MNGSCQDYIGECVRRFPEIKGRVLEVGSYDVNGNPRCHFADTARFSSYFGIDMREGPQVDEVMNCHALRFDSASFEVVVDAERLEHDDDFQQSYRELSRVLVPGGHVIITTRSYGGFPPHDYPSDYWRFMDNGLRHLLESSGIECLECVYGEFNETTKGHLGVYALGRKRT